MIAAGHTYDQPLRVTRVGRVWLLLPAAGPEREDEAS